MKLSCGTEFRKRGQLYRVVGGRDYETNSGRWIEIIELMTWCADCGSPFSLTATKTGIRRGSLNRRCDTHKKPGSPVAPRRKVARRKVSRDAGGRFSPERRAQLATLWRKRNADNQRPAASPKQARRRTAVPWGRELLDRLQREKRARRAELKVIADRRKAAAAGGQ